MSVVTCVKTETVKGRVRVLSKCLRRGTFCLSVFLTLFLGSTIANAAPGSGHGGHGGHVAGGHVAGSHVGQGAHAAGGHLDHGVHHGVVHHDVDHAAVPHYVHHGVIDHDGHHIGVHHGVFHPHAFSGFGLYQYRYYLDHCDPYSLFYDPKYCYGSYYYRYYPYPLKYGSSRSSASTNKYDYANTSINSADADMRASVPDSMVEGERIPDGVGVRAPLLSSTEAPDVLPNDTVTKRVKVK